MAKHLDSPTFYDRKVVDPSILKVNDAGLTYYDHEKPWQYQEGECTVTRGSAWSAPGCHLGCGVLIYAKDGKVVKVEGDPENPYNYGRLCPRCVAVSGVVNDESRILYPMKRAREDRGKADAWKRISWDEALDTVEQRFNEYKEQFGAESVVFFQGTGRDIAAYITRLAWSFGSPNYVFSLSNVACFGPRICSSMMTAGNFFLADYSQQFIDRYDNPEYEVPALTVVWGNNPVVANSDGALGAWTTDVLMRGSKLIVVDPRLTWMAAHADLWVRIRPGSDGAFALGVFNYMAQNGLYDKDFVEKWVFGFEQQAELAEEWTPERVAEVCWVEEDDVAKFAHMLYENSPAALQWGVALDQRIDCINASRAVLSLWAITGNIEKPGSMVVGPELLKYITGWGREFLSYDAEDRRIGTEDFIFYKVALQVANINQMIHYMAEQRDDYPIKAAWIQTVNEIACGGVDNEITMKALGQMEFNVVVDLFMTPTAQGFADLFLPVTTYPERNGIRVGDNMQRGETINKAVPAPGETKSDMEINLELGRRFNPEAWPWETVEEMFSFILSETGMDFEGVRENAPGYLPFSYYKHEKGLLRQDGNIGFETPSGRIELYSQTMEFLGLDPLPVYEEPTMTPFSQPELYEEYPLVLATGARRDNTFHSENRNEPHLRAIHPEPGIQMHPEAAARFGVKEGQWVWVEGPVGTTGRTARAKRIVEFAPDQDPRFASTDHGWWRPEADPENLYDVNELNINNLISWETGKTGVGANYKCILCKVYPVKDGE